jgi:hypothetical protein
MLLVLTFGTVFGCIYGLSTVFLYHNLNHANADSKRVPRGLSKSAAAPPRTWKF